MTQDSLGGVIAAIPTPVDPALEPDLDRFLRNGRWALDNGCDGLNVLGTTGEATSLSRAQRLAVMGAAARQLDGRRLMVGTGVADLATTIELTRAAHDLGFAAALVLPPFYYKGVSEEGLFAYFAGLVAATRDTPISLYLYNFPQMTGIAFSPEFATRLKEAFPDRIRGAKDSSGDLDYAARCATIPDFKVFPSNETSLARMRRDGFSGCISATVSVAAPLSARLLANPDDQRLLEAVSAARTAISAQPLIPAVKYLTSLIHRDPDYARVLPPQRQLTQAEIDALPAIATLS